MPILNCILYNNTDYVIENKCIMIRFMYIKCI